jgi:glycine/D-amino acid oxidase-like deaminating enzyme
VLLASPCSGHGYKFCSVVGEIMADLALDGTTRYGMDILKIDERRQGFAELLSCFHKSADVAKAKL